MKDVTVEEFRQLYKKHGAVQIVRGKLSDLFGIDLEDTALDQFNEMLLDILLGEHWAEYFYEHPARAGTLMDYKEWLANK